MSGSQQKAVLVDRIVLNRTHVGLSCSSESLNFWRAGCQAVVGISESSWGVEAEYDCLPSSSLKIVLQVEFGNVDCGGSVLRVVRTDSKSFVHFG